jgi:predicted MFS family arabinose efflux permease
MGTPLAHRPKLRGLARTFQALGHRNYWLYFWGQVVSLTGTWMQTAALTWLAFHLTQESKWPAYLSVAQVLPACLLGVWGGLLADRLPKRGLIMATQVGFAIIALVLALLSYTNTIAPWHLLILIALNGLVHAVDLPTRLAFVNDLVERESLGNAIALNALIFNTARAVGPALAAGLLWWFSPAACFMANALSYVAVLYALWLIRPPERPTYRAAGVPKPRGTGFRILAERPALAGLVALAGLFACVGWPILTLLPAFAQNDLGAGQAGYCAVLSAVGVGALIGALVGATYNKPRRHRTFLLGGVGLATLAFAVLASARTLPVAIGCAALVGLGLVLFFSTGQTRLQLSVRDDQRGRIMGVWATTLSGAIPIGSLLSGALADQVGVVPVLYGQALGGAAILIGVGVYCVCVGRTEELHDPTCHPARASAPA